MSKVFRATLVAAALSVVVTFGIWFFAAGTDQLPIGPTDANSAGTVPGSTPDYQKAPINTDNGLDRHAVKPASGAQTGPNSTTRSICIVANDVRGHVVPHLPVKVSRVGTSDSVEWVVTDARGEAVVTLTSFGPFVAEGACGGRAEFTVDDALPTRLLLVVQSDESVRVRVISRATGEAVSGAIVCRTRLFDRFEAIEVGTTDLDGKLTMPCLASGQYLSAYRDGVGVATLTHRSDRESEMVLVLESEVETCRGLVVDVSGVGIGGAALEAGPWLTCEIGGRVSELPRRTVTCDAKGAFLLAALPRGQWRLSAMAEGFAKQTFVVASTSEDLRLALEPAGYLEGVIVDAGGARVGGGSVRVSRIRETGREAQGGATAITTFRDGEFRIGGLASGTYDMEVFSSPSTSDRQRVDVVAGTVTVVRVVLEHEHYIGGYVASASGVRQGNLRLTAKSGTMEMTTVTDPVSGTFEFRNITHGEWLIQLWCDPVKEPYSTTVVECGNRSVKLILEARGSIEGALPSDGAQGVVVRASRNGDSVWRRARIDGNWFSISNLVPGVYRVRVDAQDRLPIELSGVVVELNASVLSVGMWPDSGRILARRSALSEGAVWKCSVMSLDGSRCLVRQDWTERETEWLSPPLPIGSYELVVSRGDNLVRMQASVAPKNVAVIVVE